MKTSLLICSVVLSSAQVVAQSVLVNADGTHSLIVDGRPTSTVINSNGTHSVIVNNGPTSTMINADGTHSIISNYGLTSVVVGGSGGNSFVIEGHQTENDSNQEEISNDEFSTSVNQVSKTPRPKHHSKSNKGYKKHKTPKKHRKR